MKSKSNGSRGRCASVRCTRKTVARTARRRFGGPPATLAPYQGRTTFNNSQPRQSKAVSPYLQPSGPSTMATPRKRNAHDMKMSPPAAQTPSSTWSRFLSFSSAKRPRTETRVVATSIEATEQSPRLPKLNLSLSRMEAPPSVVNDTAVTPATSTAPVAAVPAAASTVPSKSPWKSAPISLSTSTTTTDPLQHSTLPLRPRRRLEYCPRSRILASRRAPRKHSEWNAEVARRILQQSQGLFDTSTAQTSLLDSKNFKTFERGRRQLGTNQTASRLAPPTPVANHRPPAAARKQVSFDESNVIASTPHVSRSAINRRIATPIRSRPSQRKSKEPPKRKYNFTGPFELGSGTGSPQALALSSKLALEDNWGVYDVLPSVAGRAAMSLDPALVFVKSTKATPKKQTDKKTKTTPMVESTQEEPASAEPEFKRSKMNPEGWGSIFANQAPSWKCDACFVQNPLDVNVCKACEAPRPGTTSNVETKSASSDSSMSSSGFKFASGTDTKPTFSFGTTPSTDSAKPPFPSRGFSFGKPTSNEPQKSSTTGVLFGSSKADESKVEPTKNTGFSFGTPSKSEALKTPRMSFGSTADQSSDKASSTSSFSFGAQSDAPKTPATPFIAKSEKPGEGPATTNSFSFGTPAEKSEPQPVKTPAFSFGDKAASKSETPKIGGFSFGAPPPANGPTTQPFAFGQSQTKKVPAADGEKSLQTTDSSTTTTNTFGASINGTNDAGMEPPATKPFSFGMTPSSDPSVKGTDSSKPVFSIGNASTADTAPAPVVAKETKPSFSFGTPAAAPTASDNAPKVSFSFGGATTAPSVSLPSNQDDRKQKRRVSSDEEIDNDSVKFPMPAPSFGTPAPATPAPTTFTFGASAPTPAASTQFGTPAPTTGGALFGSTPSGNVSMSTSAFGSAPAPVAATSGPAFSFGATAAPPLPAAQSTFTFGGASSTQAPSSGFGGEGSSSSFGGTTGQSTGMSYGSSGNPSTPAPVSFSFGTPAPTPTPAGLPGFGSPAPAMATNGQSGFFGGTPAPSQPSSTPGFSFGGATPAPAQGAPSFGFGSGPPAPPPASGSFGFGAQPNPQQGVSFGAPGGFSGTMGGGMNPATTPAPMQGGFSIGSGGGKAPQTAGKRRIIRAKRPPGSAPR